MFLSWDWQAKDSILISFHAADITRNKLSTYVSNYGFSALLEKLKMIFHTHLGTLINRLFSFMSHIRGPDSMLIAKPLSYTTLGCKEISNCNFVTKAFLRPSV
jgi:hypothetical protein